MAVIVKAAPTLKNAKYSYGKGVYKSTYEWLLEVVHPPATLLDALPEVVASAFANQLPVEGVPHPFVPLAYCESTSCEQIKGGAFKYIVNYTDENSDTENQQYGKQENPLNDLPEITPIAGIKSFPIYKDVDDEAILNAIGDPLIDEAERQVFGFNIKTNVVGLPDWVEGLIDSKSDGGIIIRNYFIPEGEARFILPSDYLSLPKRRNGYEYFEFKFEIRIDNRDQHDGVLLDAGFYELVPKLDEEGDPVVPEVLERVHIKDSEGGEENEPRPLDPETKRALVEPQPDTVSYVRTKRYRSAFYGDLPGVEAASG